jgi:hypothetical protein
MLAVGLLLSVALPLLAGVPWLLLVTQRESAPGGWPIIIGYGYVLGLLTIVGGIWLMSLTQISVGLLSASALPIATGAIGWWQASRVLSPAIRRAFEGSRSSWLQMTLGTRFVASVAFTLIAIRFGTLAIESLVRPMFPWEAVSSFAAKARVWYELGTLVPFVPPVSVLQGLGNFTDADPSAFGLPSLLLVWTAIAIGRWHEGAIAFPWLMLGFAIALAFYGHLRRADCGIAYSLAFSYVLISLPLVDMHIALSGAPQWVAAVGVGLGGCAFIRWLESPERRLLFCSAIGFGLAGFALPTTWPWLGIVVIAGVIQHWTRAATKLAVGIPFVILVALLALMQTPVTLGGRVLKVQLASDWNETPESLLLLDNWHLLFGILLLVAVVGWRRMFSPHWRARTWVVAMGLGLMAVRGVLSLQPYWLGGLRDFSYSGLQLAPIMLMWIALLAHEIGTADRRDAKSQAIEPAR